ncbi:MAG: UDP-3-O-(3-hydroxymyristoyl)glucosamine N-acyltransferase [Spirochaetes bacterium]|nr:UDP-3-O-(3-hydroxymyristoyl)glucosamine N-acyltransferase [Spirochaetota bacterium]
MVNYLNDEKIVKDLKIWNKNIILLGNEKRTFNCISNIDNIKQNSIVYCEDFNYFDIAIKSNCSAIITNFKVFYDFLLKNKDLFTNNKNISIKDNDFVELNEKYLNRKIESIELEKILNNIIYDFLNEKNKSIILFEFPKVLWAYITSFFKVRTVRKGKIGKNSLIKSPINISEIEIGENVIIENNVKIGKNVFIGAGSYIGENVQIGDNTYIYPNVTILENCIIGSDCIIHSGTVIGSDGFGYQFYNYNHIKIEQVGRVVIGNFVEIGANCTIDRGTVDDTIISDFCKIDNLVQVAHNVVIDKGTVIAAQSGIAGGAKIGKFVFMGGQVGVADHAVIEDGAKFAAQSGASKRLYEKGKLYAGTPAIDASTFKRINAAMKYLPDIYMNFEKNVSKEKDKK